MTVFDEKSDLTKSVVNSYIITNFENYGLCAFSVKDLKFGKLKIGS